jgi:hypothetical protein
VGYFTGGRDMSAITCKIEEVSTRRGGTTFEVESNLNKLEALEQFYDNADGIRLPENFRALFGLSGNLPPLTFNGTNISIRPEAIIQHELKGKPVIGSIKLYLSRNHPLPQESAEITSVRWAATRCGKSIRRRPKSTLGVATCTMCSGVINI